MTALGNFTDALNPPHTWTPWVTINGKHEEDAVKALESFLCNGPLKNVPECQTSTNGEQNNYIRQTISYRENAKKSDKNLFIPRT